MKAIVIRLVCDDDDLLAAVPDNQHLEWQLEGVIGPAAIDVCGHVVVESVTVEDVPEEVPISIAALIRRDGRGA